jgi:hypothetical protein
VRGEAPAPPEHHNAFLVNNRMLFPNNNEEAGDNNEAAATPRNNMGTPRPVTPRRSSLRFRSSILRQNSRQEDAVGMRRSSTQRGELGVDIRASSRLIGYLYVFMASLVLFVSMVRFYQEREEPSNQFRRVLDDETNQMPQNNGTDPGNDDEEFDQVFGQSVLAWKLDVAFILACVAVASSLFIVAAHFDTWLLPNLWRKIFQDGSRHERNLLLFLMLFWAATVWVSTSSFSVGEVQANVYFVSWIAFVSVVMTYNIWRLSADLVTLEEKLGTMKRETSKNWLIVSVFTFVTSLASIEYYLNRKHITEDPFGREITIKDWRIGIGMAWSSFVVCMVALIGNHYATFSWEAKLCGGLVLSFDWRQVEGLMTLTLIGAYFWLILNYTGVTGLFNGPSNPYFGIWGTFFSSCMAFGTWIRENRRLLISWEIRPKEEQDISQRAEGGNAATDSSTLQAAPTTTSAAP